jgi:hypothetical protein
MNFKAYRILALIFIAMLILAFFFLGRGCAEQKYKIIDTVKVSDTVLITDTFRSTDTLYIKPPVRVVYIDVPYKIDTAVILKDYYARIIYYDTLRNDSSLFISMEETLSENKIKNRILHVEDYEQTKIITNETKIYIEKKIPQYYAGLFAGMQMKVPTAGVSFSFMTAKQRIITGQVGYPQTFLFGLQFPINKKNKVQRSNN